MSLPDDFDGRWEDPRASGRGAGGPSKADSTDRLAGRSGFTPSFTLLGSGPAESPKAVNPAGVLTPGSMFGVYLVGSCIGKGGMARIYQAEHAGLRRKVALKVLIDGFARDLDGRERFLREARIVAAIKHPNVVNIFDVGVHEDIPYLVMELLEGQDLESLLESKGALEEGLIIDIIIPVVAGLFAVHDAGIVHRDLKPGNIFLARGRYNDLEPKLLDFGISKTVGPEQLRLTANRGVMGTPFYISPEGLHGGEMTALSDQYSLGVVMYECATGSTPFKASAFAELSRLITSGQYTPPTTHKPELSKRLARIIERAMSLDPQNRFKDLREMGRELLLLAGQRTRITWGLSFGDPRGLDVGDARRDGPAPGPPAHEQGANPPPPANKPPRRSVDARVLLGIVPLLLLVGLFAWAFGRTALRGTAHPLIAVPSASAGGTQATAAASPADINANPPVAVAIAPLARPEGDRPAAAAGSSSEKNSAAARDQHAPRATAEPAANRRSMRPPPAPAGRRTSPAASESEPDWALPAAGSLPTQTKTVDVQVGANDAPIFD